MGVRERREREKAERREEILKAARQLFLEKGYIETTMDNIAGAVQLSIGTLYLYFLSKDEIYATLCEEGLDINNQLAAKAAETEGSCWDKLTAIMLAYLTFYQEYSSYYDIVSFLNQGFRRIGLSPELEERLTIKSDAGIKRLEDVISAGMEAGDIKKGNPTEIAFNLWGWLEGLLFIHHRGFMDAWGVELVQTAKRGAEVVFMGLKAK